MKNKTRKTAAKIETVVEAKETNLIVARPGEKIVLSDIDPEATGAYEEKEDTQERLQHLRGRLSELQEALYAEAKQSLLIVLQAMDTGGKDGAIKHLLTGINPVGVNVTSFKSPSTLERSHDFLWRVHQHAPAKGMIGVWNRSHYEDVLVVRVHKLIEKAIWQQRYEDINNFERMLTNNGVKILKFYLHISKEEQKKRLQARLDDPAKHWKFSENDLAERKLWRRYQEAFQDAINECSTEAAPWLIIPANRKWARNIAVSEAVVAALEEMNPQYPKATFDPASIVIDGDKP